MGDKVGFGYLKKLVGQTVTVFKGGPHSDTGVLEAVKKDYLVLKTKEGFVYYPVKHLKRVIGNTKQQAQTSEAAAEERTSYVFPKTFEELVLSLRMRPVSVNGGKPHNQGFLLDVNSEFMVFSSEKDGLVFYSLEHIKSLASSAVEQAETLDSIDFAGGHTFTDLLGEYLHKWVTINEGPDKVEGVLVEVNDRFTVVVKNDEVIYVANEHIKLIKQKAHDEKKPHEEKKHDHHNENSHQSDESNKSKGKNRGAIRRMIVENLAAQRNN